MRLPAWAGLVGTVALAVAALDIRIAFPDPTVRATIETALMASAFASALLLCPRAHWGRRRADVLLLVAVVSLAMQALAFSALPAILASGTRSRHDWVAVGQLVVAVAFVVAAVRARSADAAGQHECALLVGAAVLLMAGIGGVGLAWHTESSAGGWPVTALMDSAPDVALSVTGAGLMLLAGLLLSRAAGGEQWTTNGLLGPACLLLAAAWLYDLIFPVLSSRWVSGRDLLRLLAYVCLLAAGLRGRSKWREIERERTIGEERRRVANDLHDGLAQDLAFILLRGQEIERQLGGDHRLTDAARRALGAAREVIADLAAMQAPTTAAALQRIAHDLATRHHVEVRVDTDGTELSASERPEVVRIAREAMVNAIKHGGATRVTVSLCTEDGRLVLRIRDDGRGIDASLPSSDQRGFGLAAMTERAERIGGRLTIERESTGGTEVQVIV